MTHKKMNFWMIVAMILAILFVSSVVYIAVSKYRQAKDAEKTVVFEPGEAIKSNTSSPGFGSSARTESMLDIS